MKKNLFITGVGRSGTTLLQSMLSAHPSINIPPETHFIKNYVVPEFKGKKYLNDRLESILRDISSDRLIPDAKDQIPKLKELLNKSKDSDYISPKIYSILFSGQEETIYIGDKDPMNINFLPIIKMAFENAKIIHIIRDPRDVLQSRLKSDWGKRNSMIWHLSEYKYSVNKGRRDGQSLFGENYLEIKYEDLIYNPERVLITICDFLKLPFDSEMLLHYKKASSIIRSDELKWKSNVLNPIDVTKIGQWKGYFTKRQIQVIETLLKQTLLDFGYARSNDSPVFSHILAGCHAFFIERLFKLKFGS